MSPRPPSLSLPLGHLRAACLPGSSPAFQMSGSRDTHKSRQAQSPELRTEGPAPPQKVYPEKDAPFALGSTHHPRVLRVKEPETHTRRENVEHLIAQACLVPCDLSCKSNDPLVSINYSSPQGQSQAHSMGAAGAKAEPTPPPSPNSSQLSPHPLPTRGPRTPTSAK